MDFTARLIVASIDSVENPHSVIFRHDPKPTLTNTAKVGICQNPKSHWKRPMTLQNPRHHL